jgi:glycosyltransferase involved in cell wall biosynthesis
VWINARRKLHLLNLNPEIVPECCHCNLQRIGRDDYIIGQFYWELSRTSKTHEAGLALVDEIWTASRYLTGIYAAETSKTVITMGQAIVAREPTAPLSRHNFNFSDDAYLFLASFDATSIVERKNPLGTVTAFQEAFSRGDERAGLIIKTRNAAELRSEREKAHWASTLKRVRKDRRIRIIDYTMSEDELAALYRMCDCFVSLHRSEGFGFGPAEAMAHGKPAIVTNYSGVCDFCTATTAKLVDYELIRVQGDQYPYLDPDRVYEWADPKLESAAECMRELAGDREQSRRLGRAAQAFVSQTFSVEALQRRYVERLQQLGFSAAVRETEPADFEC